MTHTLTKVTNASGVAFRIDSPSFSGALTRSGGEPSDSLYARLCLALDDPRDIEIARGRSGKWYVRPITTTKLQARKARRAAAVAAASECAHCNDNGCDMCDPGVNPDANRPCTVFAHMLDCGGPQELTTFNSIDEAVAFMREEEINSHPDIAYWAEESGTNNIYDSTYELLDIADRPSSAAETQDIDASVEGDVACGRCAGTGRYITAIENGKPVGPGGSCYRCAGKGHHTHADRARNLHHDNNFVPSL